MAAGKTWPGKEGGSFSLLLGEKIALDQVINNRFNLKLTYLPYLSKKLT
ncbi:hypothetical protein KS4_31510 [Poriferisphaera corsica]|uniref:Uncharacterized protein n=1 Tax=Poriferisphaera corsica TaxID=2528020 RepID=A0A517YXW7_9BACT|nr:hypothetical protein KS4_31510 [Poriferisphaera corsica]